MTVSDPALFSHPGDPSFDYCLWPYEPPAPQAQGALRSEAMLRHSFEVAGVAQAMAPICTALQQRVGRFRTVWGIKHRAGQLSWEFYFYDYGRSERRFGLADFCRATQGLLTVTAPARDDRPYFMFSVEITPENLRGMPIDQIDIYIGNPSSTVSSGICYGVSAKGIEMRNLYFFFDAIPHAQDIRDKILSNAHVPASRLRLDHILWPEITDVQTIVVANKRDNDGLYFSRIGIDMVLICLDRLQFPEPLRAFVRDNHESFQHHLFDVGYDYLPDPKGGLQYLKGSYYGLL